LEKENATKSDDLQQQQQKSLDCSEHDSLDTVVTTTTNTTTTTSNESNSKRSENVLKAFERRYHLLYLNAIETQCTFEGLLEKRNLLKTTQDFQQIDIDTSDEEPIAKIPKFDGGIKFSSQKCDESVQQQQQQKKLKVVSADCDGDADSEGSEEEMECIAVNNSIDCVDSVIVPVTKSTISPNNTTSTTLGAEEKQIKASPLMTPKSSPVKRTKDFSKFHRSNRKSKNCAIFYYKHIDTDNDNDQLNDENHVDNPIVSSSESSEEVWEYTENNDETLTENCAVNGEVKASNDEHAVNTNSTTQQNLCNASNTTKVLFTFTAITLITICLSLSSYNFPYIHIHILFF
jgi:hypothetical protein